ncbi:MULTISPECIES: hypothetical protein [Thalassospira]|uniref:Uncharacterized protein n=2 Tax=Thalassospira TaxID=168934 RepID=A0A367VYD2_9PROT|nr:MULTISPECIES: hypothetical protein [Thalassospira]MDG4721802.1 hypothetical protein [Thalassospira sp. FZY0004]RCK30820.1 hypothetical protein TH19_22240 [Thalassospira profundimaris]
MFRIVRGSLLMVVILSIALVASMGMNILTYVRLTDEEPIAALYFEPVSEDVYTAHLVSDDPGVSGTYEILGDQWRIDAEFIKLKPWANIIGMDARYQLVRFEGRYRDVVRQNTAPFRAYDLGAGDALDLVNYLAEWNFLIDAEYGSSTFSDIEEDTVYRVYRTQSGIIIRSEPMPDPIGYEPSMMDQFANWISGKP